MCCSQTIFFFGPRSQRLEKSCGRLLRSGMMIMIHVLFVDDKLLINIWHINLLDEAEMTSTVKLVSYLVGSYERVTIRSNHSKTLTWWVTVKTKRQVMGELQVIAWSYCNSPLKLHATHLLVLLWLTESWSYYNSITITCYQIITHGLFISVWLQMRK